VPLEELVPSAVAAVLVARAWLMLHLRKRRQS
jgi:hypothetical protein